MHGPGITMIEVIVVAGVERHLAPVVEAHRHRVSPDGLDGPERAVLHFETAVVLQEVQPVSGGEISGPARRLDPMVDVELASLLAVLSGELVELLHFVAAVGQHDLGLAGLALAASLPSLHHSRDGFALRLVTVNMPMRIVLPQRWQRLATGQLLRRLPLPVDLLTSDLAQLVRADMLPNGPQGRTRLDGLQLLCVSDEHHLGASLLDVLHHPLHLPGADHAGLVDDEHVLAGSARRGLSSRRTPSSPTSARLSRSLSAVLRPPCQRAPRLSLGSPALPTPRGPPRACSSCPCLHVPR